MKATEFFNLFPEEVDFIKRHYKECQTIQEIAKKNGQQVEILIRTETTLLCKVSSGLRHCGIKMTTENLKKALVKGQIEIKEEEERDNTKGQ